MQKGTSWSKYSKFVFFRRKRKETIIKSFFMCFIVSYCTKLIYDVIKGNRYGDNV